MNAIGQLIQLILRNKKKIFLVVLFYALFLFLLFPFSDLGNFVTAQVAQATRNQVFVKFETLDVKLVPAPGIEATNVKAQGTMFPMITADYVSASPSIAGLITLNPGISLKAEGLMDGNVGIVTKTAGSTATGTKRQNISVRASDVNLAKLIDTFGLSMSLEGKLGLDTNTTIDPNFIEQPTGKVDLNVKELNLTAASLMTPIGPLNLPDTKLKVVEVKGNMNRGEFSFEKAVLGSAQDELFAQVKGTMNLNFQMAAQGQMNVVPGAFDLTVQIRAKPNYVGKAGLFLGFLDQYKKKESARDGNEYLFRMTGQDFYNPPRISPIANF